MMDYRQNMDNHGEQNDRRGRVLVIGLDGATFDLIKPWAAAELIGLFKRYGIWPNDATMCVQLVPYLQEMFPFITRVEQTMSTTAP